MSRRTILLALSTLAFTMPAFGQRVGKPAPEITAPNHFGDAEHVSLAKYRNKILVLVFFRTNDNASVDVLTELSKLHKNFGKRGVQVLGYTPENERETIENLIKGKELLFPVIYGGDLVDVYECPAFPHAYLIDTQGVLVWRGHAGDDLEDRVKAQIRKTPPTGSEATDLRARLQKAEQLLGKKDVGRAYTIAREVADMADKDSDVAEKAKSLKERIEKAAREVFDEAKEAAKKEDFEQAAALVAMLSVRFEGTDIGRDVDSEIARLRGSGNVKSLIRKAVENAKGELKNEQAAEHEAGKRYAEALKLYRETVEKHPDTEAAKTAQAAVDRISKDSSVQADIAKGRTDEEADRWFDLGERFARVQLYDLAREQFNKVIKAHPDSDAAGKARERLESLPKDS